MKIVDYGNKLIKRLCTIKYDSEIAYRKMKYIVSFEVENGILLCNTITGELILVSCDNDWNENKEYLANSLFIVPKDYDEEKLSIQLRKVLKTIESSNSNNRIYSYVILPTTSCNARCFYCYQNEEEKIHMSESVKKGIVNFIIHNSEKEIYIDWFGGEPTLGENEIDYICEELIQNDIKYESSMTSNGYLFDDTLIKKANELWKLKKIQITLDGTEAEYNKIKQFQVNDPNPYKRVLENIEKLIDNSIHVNLRLNIDFHNDKDMIVLVDELIERFEGKKNLTIYLHELVSTESFGHERNAGELNNIFEVMSKLENKLIDKKLTDNSLSILPHLKYNNCMADGVNTVLINPKGEIAKCEDKVNSYIVGNIIDGINNMENAKDYKKSIIWDECHDCCMQPFCYHLEKCTGQNHFCSTYSKERLISFVRNKMFEVYENWRIENEAKL